MRRWLGSALFFGCCGIPLSCSAVLGIEDLPGPKDGGVGGASVSQFCGPEAAKAAERSLPPHRYCADFDDGLRSLWQGQTRQAEGLLVVNPAKTTLETGDPVADRYAVTSGTTLRLEATAGKTATLDVSVEAKLPMGKVTMLRVVFHTVPEVHVSLWEENFTTVGIDIERKVGGSTPTTVSFPVDGGSLDGSRFVPYRIVITEDLTITVYAGGGRVLNDSFSDVGRNPVPFDVIVGAVDPPNALARIDKLTVDEAPDP